MLQVEYVILVCVVRIVAKRTEGDEKLLDILT